MRTIKFRAWVPKQKRFYYWGHRIDPHGAYFTGPPAESTAEHQQFTGLKDKNGVEIYEGDVVRHPPTGYSARIESLVDFENGGFYPFADDWDNAPYPKAQECEVIGNIYENPELMK